MGRIEAVHNAVRALKPKKRNRRPGLSSGSTLLNLACTDRTDEAFYPGGRYHIVGDSDSGKSFMANTCMAEAAINPAFAHYKLIYDDAEGGSGFDFGKFFPILKGKVKAPRYDGTEPRPSAYLEDFYDNLDDLYQKGEPFIYVLDSMDVLWPRADSVSYAKRKKVRRKNEANDTDEKEGGSYGMAKAKLNSELLRVAVPKIRKTGSILVIISQAKTDMNPYGSGKTNSGGLSLKYYCQVQMWLSIGGHYKKTVMGKDREQGIKSIVRIGKNHQTGKKRKVMVPFYHSTGLDDTGGMVEFLLEEGHWKKGQSGINARELGLKGKFESLVKQIEENDDVPELRSIVKRVWDGIEEASKVERKNRYV